MPIVRRVVKPKNRFGRLVVYSYAGKNNQSTDLYLCVCDCGQRTIVRKPDLLNGNTKSCGCFQKEEAARIRRTHGESGEHLHVLWHNIKKRCYNEDSKHYHNYGGRGILLYEPWHDYATFAADIRAEIGERPTENHSLDRVDNDKNYEPGNVRWATRKEQAHNQRRSAHITYRGQTKTTVEWSEELGISRHTLYNRIFRLGWTVERAFEE